MKKKYSYLKAVLFSTQFITPTLSTAASVDLSNGNFTVTGSDNVDSNIATTGNQVILDSTGGAISLDIDSGFTLSNAGNSTASELISISTAPSTTNRCTININGTLDSNGVGSAIDLSNSGSESVPITLNISGSGSIDDSGVGIGSSDVILTRTPGIPDGNNTLVYINTSAAVPIAGTLDFDGDGKLDIQTTADSGTGGTIQASSGEIAMHLRPANGTTFTINNAISNLSDNASYSSLIETGTIVIDNAGSLSTPVANGSVKLSVENNGILTYNKSLTNSENTVELTVANTGRVNVNANNTVETEFPVTINSGGNLTILGTFQENLSNATTITNNGIISISGSTSHVATLDLNNASNVTTFINNDRTFVNTNGRFLSSSNKCRVVNNNDFSVDGNATFYPIVTLNDDEGNYAIDNNGTFTVEVGELNINQGGILNPNDSFFYLSFYGDGAVVNFNSSNGNPGNQSINNDGTFNLDINATFNLGASGGSARGATFNNTSNGILNIGDLSNPSIFRFSDTNDPNPSELNSTGAVNLRFSSSQLDIQSGTANITSDQITNTGIITVGNSGNSAALNYFSPNTTTDNHFVSSGVVNIENAGTLTLGAPSNARGSTFNSTGTINIASGGILQFSDTTDTNASILNASQDITNDGTLSIQSGTLNYTTRGFNNTGTGIINVGNSGNSATLNHFSTNDTSLNDFDSAGTINVLNGGTIVIGNAGNVRGATLNNLASNPLNISNGGTVRLTDTSDSNRSFLYSYSDINNAGEIDIQSGSLAFLNTSTLTMNDGSVLHIGNGNNPASLTFSGSNGYLALTGDSAVINIEANGTLDTTDVNGTNGFTAGNATNNTSIILLSRAANQPVWNLAKDFENTNNTIDIQSGAVNMSLAQTIDNNSVINVGSANTGALNMADGSLLNQSTGIVNVNNNGTVSFVAGIPTNRGNFNIGNNTAAANATLSLDNTYYRNNDGTTTIGQYGRITSANNTYLINYTANGNSNFTLADVAANAPTATFARAGQDAIENQYNATITVNSGTLNVTDGGINNVGAIAVGNSGNAATFSHTSVNNTTDNDFVSSGSINIANAGVLELGGTLKPSGTLAVAAGGTINLLDQAANAPVVELSTNVTNAGTINIRSGQINFQTPSTLSGAGTINIGDGNNAASFDLNTSGSNLDISAGGTVDINTLGTLDTQNGSVTTGGASQIRLIADTATNAPTWNLGSSNFSGDNNTITVNSGTIEMLTANTFTNPATGTITLGAGNNAATIRTPNVFTNTGAMTLNANSVIDLNNNANATFVNDETPAIGALTVSGASIIQSTGASLGVTNKGQILGASALTIDLSSSNGTFTNSETLGGGTIAPPLTLRLGSGALNIGTLNSTNPAESGGTISNTVTFDGGTPSLNINRDFTIGSTYSLTNGAVLTLNVNAASSSSTTTFNYSSALPLLKGVNISSNAIMNTSVDFRPTVIGDEISVAGTLNINEDAGSLDAWNLKSVSGTVTVAATKTFFALGTGNGANSATFSPTSVFNLNGNLNMGGASSGDILSQGTINLGDGANAATMTSDIGNFTNEGTITVNNNGILALQGASGKFTNQGSAVLQINQGTVNLGGDTISNTGTAAININNGNFNINTAHQFTNDSTMTISNGGTLRNNNAAILNNGTITLGTTGVIEVSDNTSASFINAGTTTITDDAKIMTAGATGGLVSSTGTLVLNTGVNPAIDLSTNNSSNSTFTTSGTLETGTNGASINLYQGAQWTAGGTLIFSSDSFGNVGVLKVNASDANNTTPNLTGVTTVQIKFPGKEVEFTDNDKLLLIEGNNNISLGNVNFNISNNSRLYNFISEVDGSNLYITADHADYTTLVEVPFIAGASQGILSGAKKSPELKEVMQALDELTNEEIGEALEQFVPEISNLVDTKNLQIVSNTSNMYQQRLAMIKKNNTVYTAGDSLTNHSVWFKGFTGAAFQKKRQGVEGYKMYLRGYGLGADTSVDDLIMGVGFSYSDTKSKQRTRYLREFKTKNYQLAAYFSKDFHNQFFTDGLISYIQSKFSRVREVDFPGFNNYYLASYPGRQYTAELKAGYYTNFYDFLISPDVSLQYAKSAQNKYVEYSSSLDSALRVEKDFRTTLQGKIGFKAHNKYQSGNLYFEPSFSFHMHHDFVKEKQIIAASFVGGGNSFVTQGPTPASTGYNIGLGISTRNADSLEFTFGYDLQLKSKFHSHYLLANLRYKF